MKHGHGLPPALQYVIRIVLHCNAGGRPGTMLYNRVSECYRVRVFQILVNLRVAEDGVALTHSPEHALEGLDIRPLNQS